MANWGAGATGALGGAAAGSFLGPLGSLGGAALGGLTGLFSSKPKEEKIRNQSLLRPEQEPLLQNAINAGLQPGVGGAFGQSADYYRDLLGNNDQDYQRFAAPQMRQYNEEIVPGLAEQFAGMGAGGLSSSGFRNAALNSGVDLSERLGALRAQLRQSGAQGLANIGQMGLGQFGENVRNTPQPGFWQNAAEGIGQALPSVATNWLSSRSSGNNVGANTSGYQGGNNIPASPSPSGYKGTFGQLPNYGAR